VQQDYLRMKAARQPRGLVHDVTGSLREHNRNKNFLNAQHHATHYQLIKRVNGVELDQGNRDS
jgi:hypothetical protein